MKITRATPNEDNVKRNFSSAKGRRRDPGGESRGRDAHEPGRRGDHNVDTEAARAGHQARATPAHLAQPAERA